MKNKLYRTVVVVLTIIIAAGMTAYCCIATYFTAKQFAENTEYVIKNKVNTTDAMRDSYGKGFGAVRSYYMGYAFENPNFTEGEFYSELRNAKGEVVASYRPFIILESGTEQNVEDARIIFWDENATVSYESKRNAGVTVEVKDDGYKHALNELWNCAEVHNNRAPLGDARSIEIYGTCDDNFVYLEKMIWQTEMGEAVYTYTPTDNQTASGKMSVESWKNSLNSPNYYINATNLADSFYQDEPLQNAEAKALCEELSKEYIEETFNVDEIESSSDIKNLETFFVEKVADIGDGYFVSSVYVCHPLQIARARLTVKYVGCALTFAAWLILAVCIVIYQKRESSKKVVENAFVEVKEDDSQYEK
ncbi:MAG: hypothetical protein J6D06_04610 [Clostridia bacterium]|nr:hypothetical protein [Clostridia bacterium]